MSATDNGTTKSNLAIEDDVRVEEEEGVRGLGTPPPSSNSQADHAPTAHGTGSASPDTDSGGGGGAVEDFRRAVLAAALVRWRCKPKASTTVTLTLEAQLVAAKGELRAKEMRLSAAKDRIKELRCRLLHQYFQQAAEPMQDAFRFLDGPTDVLSASTACRQWHEFACADAVWRAKVEREGILDKAIAFEVEALGGEETSMMFGYDVLRPGVRAEGTRHWVERWRERGRVRSLIRCTITPNAAAAPASRFLRRGTR